MKEWPSKFLQVATVRTFKWRHHVPSVLRQVTLCEVSQVVGDDDRRACNRCLNKLIVCFVDQVWSPTESELGLSGQCDQIQDVLVGRELDFPNVRHDFWVEGFFSDGHDVRRTKW